MLKKQKSSVLKKQSSTVLARYKQWLRHAFQNQLFLCAYLHGKRIIPLACERVITCRVRAFTFFPETPWRVTYGYGYKAIDIRPNDNTKYGTFLGYIAPKKF